MAVTTVLGAAVVSLAVAAATTPVVVRLAHRWGVLDLPGPLKPHAAPVAYLGGVAVLAGVATGLAAAGSQAPLRALAPLVMALALGLLDDVADLGVVPRLAGEGATGAVAGWAVGGGSVVGYLLVAGLCVVLVNAVNFVDGIDGLAAATCCLTGAGIAVVSTGGWAALAGAVAGASAGFLLYNRPPARIYLGDAGSYLLGTALALLAGAYGRDHHSGPGLVVVVAMLALPLAEIVSTVLRRLVARRPLFVGDRDHIYDRLLLRGLPAARVTALLAAAHGVLVTVAVVLATSSIS